MEFGEGLPVPKRIQLVAHVYGGPYDEDLFFLDFLSSEAPRMLLPIGR